MSQIFRQARPMPIAFVAALLVSPMFPAGVVAAQTVSVTVTTADQSKLLSPQSSVSFGSAATGSYTISVNDAQTYQTWDGVGAAMTDATANVISQLSSSAQTSLMTQLFSPTSGIGLSFIRNPMGASDFATSTYSYDDNGANNGTGGSPDPNLNNFSIAHDASQIMPLIQKAQGINPSVLLLSAPWSPPAWMKNNGDMRGGTFNSGSDSNALAQYFVKYIQAYQAKNIPVYAVAVQNEPENATSTYASESLLAADEAGFIGANLGPALANAGLGSVKIFGYDHNWVDYSYAVQVAKQSYTTGSAFHCYSQRGETPDPTNQSNARNQSGKDTWFTECTRIAGSFGGNLQQDAEQVVIGSVRNSSRSAIFWNAVLDQNNGPHVPNACGSCLGVVNVNTSTGAVTPSPEYYALGHIGKFVVPGALNVYSTSQANGGLLDVAFRNPDGTIAVIAYNDSSSSQTFTINWNSKNANYTLPAGAMATFKWQGTNGIAIAPNTYYTVKNVNSGLCVDAASYGTTNGTKLQQYTCGSNQANQVWQFVATTGGYYRVVSRGGASNEQVWDINGGPSATANGTSLQTYLWSQGTNQQWQPVSLGNGQWKFVALNSGRCLDVPSGSGANNTVLDEFDCNGTGAQAFTLAAQ